MDYVPFIGATTRINHVPRGKSDTSGKLIFLFHIPMGGPFLLAPMIGHDSVNFFGSKKVKVEGNLMSPSGHMLMTCNDIGIPLSLTPGKKFIPIPSLYLPTSYSIPLSFGKPVNVGGPFVPDWAGVLLNLVMSYGFGAAMKGLGKMGRKGLTKFNHKLKSKIGSNKLSKALCKKGFEPVDLVQGIVIYDGADFELPGIIPLKWERSWNSDSTFEGLLGYGQHCRYDMRVQEFPAEDATVVLLEDGRSAVFDALPYPGDSEYNRHEKLLLTRTESTSITSITWCRAWSTATAPGNLSAMTATAACWKLPLPIMSSGSHATRRAPFSPKYNRSTPSPACTTPMAGEQASSAASGPISASGGTLWTTSPVSARATGKRIYNATCWE
jgi:hypothetical protein